MPARFNRRVPRAELEVRLRVFGQKFRRDADQRRFRRRNSQVIEECRGHPLIHQDAAMLRIVEEFYDVVASVGGLQEMRLRSAAHLANQSAGIDRHSKKRYLRGYMTEDEKPTTPPRAGASPGMSKDEIALELTRFIAVTTGVGKTSSGAGFGGKNPKTPEEQVEALLQLFERCRGAMGKD